MRSFEEDSTQTRICARCGGRAFYSSSAVVPGDPVAPRGSRRSEPHVQPAWQCLACGYVEPHDRRLSRPPRHAW